MIEKPITYKNPFKEGMITRTYCFGLYKSELAEMNLRHKGDLGQFLTDIVESDDNDEIITNFKKILDLAIGRRERGIDGDDILVKTPEVLKEFHGSGAYDAFFMWMLENAREAAEFIEAMMPPEMLEEAEAARKAEENKTYTDEQLLEMSWDDFYKAAGGKDDRKWDRQFLLVGMRRKSLSNA